MHRDSTKNQMELVCVNQKTYKKAIEIQHTIFPTEKHDGEENILSSLGLIKKPFSARYYLAMQGERHIGITGLYRYHNSTQEVWLGWFGILPQYRGDGYGRALLERSMDMARQEGYQTLRLYTDEENAEARNLYQKAGFVSEIYSAQKLPYQVLIYSKNLHSDTAPTLWGNKNLYL